jgi:hypothetical protein
MQKKNLKQKQRRATIITTVVSEKKEVKDLEIIENRKIVLATEGFTTNKFCELLLKDRDRISRDNALTICDYIIAMKREVNPRLSYIKYTIQFLAELSKIVGIEKKFIDMTKDDVLLYLDSCRKPENDDPLHKWIGTYNIRRIILFRFFKWLQYPDIAKA